LRDSAKTFLESDLNSRELFIKRHAVTLTRMRSTGSDSVHVNIIPTKPQPVPALVSLTARQRSVAQEILAGLTIPEVASELNLSVETVRSHLKAIYSIFDVSNRIEFVKAASANAKTPPA
ncbi:MAG: helix-turn-helix transcriptional regulator, partial [Deltaproteobacteria bacterium]|nr:helix-turn-helix transcriptional regulator [Deltaproteobacteria bacterium]